MATYPAWPDEDEPAALPLEQLFRRCYSRLVYFAYQITGHRESAEGIAQEAFIPYWNQREQVARTGVLAFLYSTVRNASLNTVRHHKVVQLHQSQAQAAPPPPEAGPDVVRALVSTGRSGSRNLCGPGNTAGRLLHHCAPGPPRKQEKITK